MKSLPTELTNIRLIALMNSRVSVEGGGSIEGLSARLTFMRLIRCVNDFVTTEG